jgi:hypothetical protein
MNKLKLLLVGLVLAPALAFGQVRAGISIDLPLVLPPLVVVQPGVQVVPECDQEVFYTGGYYWVRQDGYWYRSRNHRGGWVAAPARAVPVALVRMPPGHYKHWKAEKHENHWRGDYDRPARPAGYREYRDDDRGERRGHDHDRDEDHDRGHGHGHGHDRD